MAIIFRVVSYDSWLLMGLHPRCLWSVLLSGTLTDGWIQTVWHLFVHSFCKQCKIFYLPTGGGGGARERICSMNRQTLFTAMWSGRIRNQIIMIELWPSHWLQHMHIDVLMTRQMHSMCDVAVLNFVKRVHPLRCYCCWWPLFVISTANAQIEEW